MLVSRGPISCKLAYSLLNYDNGCINSTRRASHNASHRMDIPSHYPSYSRIPSSFKNKTNNLFKACLLIPIMNDLLSSIMQKINYIGKKASSACPLLCLRLYDYCIKTANELNRDDLKMLLRQDILLHAWVQ